MPEIWHSVKKYNQLTRDIKLELTDLSIINYKNLEQVEISLSPKINCFIGDNGMGKTNLLDAVYYLSFCKSHTNPVDSQIIRHDTDMCMIKGKYNFEDTVEEIFCGLKRRQKKQFKRNKKDYERLVDHIGFIPLVMISPADINLINGTSEERRRFMDMAISQFDKEYLYSLVRYNKALQQRNALIKMNEQIDATLLELWESQMAENAEFVHKKRCEFIENFTPIFENYYSVISKSKERVSFKYISHLFDGDLHKMLLNNRQRDIAIGHTTSGIHRDELEMLLNDYPIKKVGSQGQCKTYFVSMKFAQFNYLLKQDKQTPILLLDDIFDRLDSERVEEIVKLVSGEEFGQIFISDTNRESLDKILSRIDNNHHIYNVKNGEITLLNG